MSQCTGAHSLPGVDTTQERIVEAISAAPASLP